jgi:hypothetical protein
MEVGEELEERLPAKAVRVPAREGKLIFDSNTHKSMYDAIYVFIWLTHDVGGIAV